MTQIYIADCTSYENKQAIARVLSRMDARRQEKVRALQSPNKKAQSVVAGLLLEVAFGPHAAYRYTENGKPYLADNTAYFSISHSEKWVALAVSDREIGLDLQKISPIRPAVLRRCFTPQEQRWIDGDDRRFTQLWVKKEAYGKYTGRGLTAPFATLSYEDTVPFCEGEWEQMRYALYGDDTAEIKLVPLHEKDLL